MLRKKIACISDETKKAKEACKLLKKKYDFIDDTSKANVIVALGGDGFMLKTLHDYMNKNVAIYGMNCGSVGFLMNEFREEDLVKSIKKANLQILTPLKMIATTADGQTHEALAINEVSLLRQTRQAAHLRLIVDGKIRIKELVCDGVLLATAAGSTAYNLSVHGPIVPIGSGLLALTPISPFRPRRWKGALLKHKASLKVNILENKKRPVSAVADFTEVRNVISVEVCECNDSEIKILFDEGHSLEDRIISEQFMPS